MESVLFVVVTTTFGILWLGKTTKEDFESWEKGGKLKLIDARSLMSMEHPDTPGMQVAVLGPVYPGDTPQKNLYMDAVTAVEPVGEIECVNGMETCAENNRLYQSYYGAVEKWKAARANISIATTGDLENINRTIPFPRR